MKQILGISWETTLGAVFTAIGLVPQAIESLELTEIPQWLRITGLVCSFISFIYMGVMAKSINVTGTGIEAERGSF
jgi:hypothetical protein